MDNESLDYIIGIKKVISNIKLLRLIKFISMSYLSPYYPYYYPYSYRYNPPNPGIILTTPITPTIIPMMLKLPLEDLDYKQILHNLDSEGPEFRHSWPLQEFLQTSQLKTP